ncbi:alpha/beta hydrolase-fold protein [Winogradskyella sp.]|uniref:alpha/beta hydrolase n=1 Tax=Winogradskyella sp. TaxID=1883156 RepID=UPI003BADB78A
MKNICLAFLLYLCFQPLIGQNSNTISIGKIESLDSEILNETRKIWVHVPEGNYNKMSSTKTYPVLYLLDGNSHFYSVVGMMRQLSSSNRNTVLPKMIVVGIPNTDRIRDLSPTTGNYYSGDSTVTKSGGGHQFMSFIEHELIPYIDSKYPTESYRTFVGHSLGGLTVMNTLINNPELFKSYIAIDPSMWWNNKNLLKKIKTTKLDKRYNGRTLYLGIANTAGMDTLAVKKDTTYDTRHLRAILELNSFLKNKDNLNHLSYKGKYYEEESHASVPLITTYDALRFVFSFYQLDINERELIDPEKDILYKIKNHYERLSKEYGREMKPELYFIENLARRLIDKQQLKKAESLLRYNTTNYPENHYPYNILGDFYVTTGDKMKAIECYKKSFALNQNSYARDKIKVLEI